MGFGGEFDQMGMGEDIDDGVKPFRHFWSAFCGEDHSYEKTI